MHGRFELLAPDHEQLWAFTRTLGEDRLLVLANCSSEPLDLGSVGLPCADGAEPVLGVNLSILLQVLLIRGYRRRRREDAVTLPAAEAAAPGGKDGSFEEQREGEKGE